MAYSSHKVLKLHPIRPNEPQQGIAKDVRIEALKRLFPKKVREELKRVAHENDPKPKKKEEKNQ